MLTSPCHIVGGHRYLRGISYVWGDQRNLARILVDEKPINVTINLANALRFIRHPKEAKLVSADVVCINQGDDTEKGHKVKRMGSVYESTKKVLVWLGKDSQGAVEDCSNLIQDTNMYLNARFERYGEWGRIANLTSQSSISTDRSRWEKVLKLMSLP
jgi:Heterokaryon incompatibility protein (HET)